MEFKKQLIQDILDGFMDDEALAEFVVSRDPEIAAAAASVVSTAEMVDKSASHSDKNVRLAALKNSNISKETVTRLCTDDDVDVRTEALTVFSTLG